MSSFLLFWFLYLCSFTLYYSTCFCWDEVVNTKRREFTWTSRRKVHIILQYMKWQVMKMGWCETRKNITLKSGNEGWRFVFELLEKTSLHYFYYVTTRKQFSNVTTTTMFYKYIWDSVWDYIPFFHYWNRHQRRPSQKTSERGIIVTVKIVAVK